MSCVVTKWPDLRHLTGSGAQVAKIWSTPMRKMSRKEEYEWLHDIADKAMPTVRDAFLDAVDKVRGTPKEAELRAAIATGNVDAVMRVLDIDAAMSAALSAKVIPPLEDVFIAAGRAAPEKTIPSQLLGGELGFRFDIVNPKTVEYLRTANLELIREVTDETRLAVRDVVQRAVEQGGAPKVQAREIRQLVGLTRRQATAVQNYEAALIEEGRKPDQIDRMTAKYREKMLNMRATTIARTETLRSSNKGAVAAWRAAADKGLMNAATLRQQWLTTPDDRMCQHCAPVPAMNEGGVPLGGMFKTPIGPVDMPPLHPNCRCVLVLESF